MYNLSYLRMNFYFLIFIVVIVSGKSLEDLRLEGKGKDSLRNYKHDEKKILNELIWEGGNKLGAFNLLKEVYKQMHMLETRVANIKYIQNEKITYELLDIVTEFDLFCGKEMDYKSAYACYRSLLTLYYQRETSMTNVKLDKIGGLINNFKYLNSEYVNLKVSLFEIITTYVNDEFKLKDLYDKYISKENILTMMKDINL